jgi:hypothetical protein
MLRVVDSVADCVRLTHPSTRSEMGGTRSQVHFRELRAAITGETIETLDENALLSILVLDKAQAQARYRKRSRLSEERRASARIEAALDVDVLAALQ